MKTQLTMFRAIKIPALFCVNHEQVDRMEAIGLDVEEEMVLLDVYVYVLDSTAPYQTPRVYNNGEITCHTLVYTSGTEYMTPLTQSEIYNLYNESNTI